MNIKTKLFFLVAITVVILIGSFFFNIEPSLNQTITRNNLAQVNSDFHTIWGQMHPDDKTRWENENEYIEAITQVNATEYSSIEIKEKIPLKTWVNFVTGKEYTDVQKITLIYFTKEHDSYENNMFYQKTNEGWRFFTSLISKADRERMKVSAMPGPAYKELIKNPDKFKGQAVFYTGEVIQIQENTNGDGYIRIDIEGETFDDIIYVTYSNGTDAIEGDNITIYGLLSGSITYTSQANYQITIPSMLAGVIENKDKVDLSISETKPITTTPPKKEKVEPFTETIVVPTTPPLLKSTAYCSVANECDGIKIKIDFEEDINSCDDFSSNPCNFINSTLQTKDIYYITVRGDTISGKVNIQNINSGAEQEYESISGGSYDPLSGALSFWYGYWIYPNIQVDFVSITNTGILSGNNFTGEYKYSGLSRGNTRGLVTYLPITTADKIPKKNCSIKGDRDIFFDNIPIYHLPTSASYKDITDPDEWFCSEDDAIDAGYKKSLR